MLSGSRRCILHEATAQRARSDPYQATSKVTHARPSLPASTVYPFRNPLQPSRLSSPALRSKPLVQILVKNPPLLPACLPPPTNLSKAANSLEHQSSPTVTVHRRHTGPPAGGRGSGGGASRGSLPASWRVYFCCGRRADLDPRSTFGRGEWS